MVLVADSSAAMRLLTVASSPVKSSMSCSVGSWEKGGGEMGGGEIVVGWWDTKMKVLCIHSQISQMVIGAKHTDLKFPEKKILINVGFPSNTREFVYKGINCDHHFDVLLRGLLGGAGNWEGEGQHKSGLVALK